MALKVDPDDSPTQCAVRCLQYVSEQQGAWGMTEMASLSLVHASVGVDSEGRRCHLWNASLTLAWHTRRPLRSHGNRIQKYQRITGWGVIGSEKQTWKRWKLQKRIHPWRRAAQNKVTKSVFVTEEHLCLTQNRLEFALNWRVPWVPSSLYMLQTQVYAYVTLMSCVRSRRSQWFIGPLKWPR